MYADRCSKDEHLLRDPVCENKKYKLGGRLKATFHILFCGDS
jgi:hypothetical protein